MKPKWLEIAEQEIGQKEVPGEASNPRITLYHSRTSLKATSDEVPWCSSFANFCMVEAGIKGTGSAQARSWLKWGVELSAPRLGCIVVLRRGDPPSGHVGFFVGYNGEDQIRVLGGNQSDQVKISTYPVEMILGYRWAEGVK